MLLKLKKVWIWFQNYWFVPVLAASSILMYYLFRKKTGAVQDVLQTKKESYEKQIQILNDSHEKELQKKEELVREYFDTVEKLDNEYKKQKLNLKDWERKKVKKIVEETHKDPKSRVKRISEEFGFELVEILEEDNAENTDSSVDG